MSDFDNGDFTETTHRSWFQRIGDSIKGILIGLILVAGSSAMLFWNEGRAARTAAALTEGAGVVRTVASNTVASSNEGKLVHVSGDTNAPVEVSDPDTGFTQKGLKLARSVEMYQW
ncbi:MAG: hypothetical protein NWT00_06510, partial [Beijerinckiaceae bacterium]|nr:hypothetical protein [Beijerinckiaceae bacterium]